MGVKLKKLLAVSLLTIGFNTTPIEKPKEEKEFPQFIICVNMPPVWQYWCFGGPPIPQPPPQSRKIN